jgi:hypothetical protein
MTLHRPIVIPAKAGIHVLFLCYISLVALHLSTGNMSLPWVLIDEFGYLGNAAYFAGYNWSEILSQFHFYGFGYSLLLVPLFFLLDDPNHIYMGIMIFNALTASAIVFVAYAAGRRLFPKLSASAHLLSALAVSLYPAYLVYSNMAWPEVFFAFLFWLSFLSFLVLGHGTKGAYSFALTGILIGFIYMVHPRGLSVVAAASLTILAALYVRFDVRKRICESVSQLSVGAHGRAPLRKHIGLLRHCDVNPCAFFAGLVPVLLLQKLLTGYLVQNLYASQTSIHTASLARMTKFTLSMFDPVRMKNFVANLLGQAFYLGAASYLIMFLGSLVVAREVFRWAIACAETRPRKRENEAQQCANVLGFPLGSAYLLLSMILMILTSAIFTHRGTGTKPDFILYGRYNEGIVGPVLLVGLLALMNNSQAEQKRRVSEFGRIPPSPPLQKGGNYVAPLIKGGYYSLLLAKMKSYFPPFAKGGRGDLIESRLTTRFINHLYSFFFSASIFGLLAAVLYFCFRDQLHSKFAQPINIIGIYPLMLANYRIHIIYLTAAVAIVAALLFSLFSRWPRVAVCLFIALFLLRAWFPIQDILRPEAYRISKNAEIANWLKTHDDLAPVYFTKDLVQCARYQWLLPNRKFAIVKDYSELRERQDCFAITGSPDPANLLKDAVMLAVENDRSLYLWSLSETVRMQPARNGVKFLITPKFSLASGEAASKVTLRRKGIRRLVYSHAYQLNRLLLTRKLLFYFATRYTITVVKRQPEQWSPDMKVGILWFSGEEPEKAVAEYRAPLPHDMEQGRRYSIKALLFPFDSKGNLLPPGDYVVRIGLVQEGAKWFYETGEDLLRISVRVR